MLWLIQVSAEVTVLNRDVSEDMEWGSSAADLVVDEDDALCIARKSTVSC